MIDTGSLHKELGALFVRLYTSYEAESAFAADMLRTLSSNSALRQQVETRKRLLNLAKLQQDSPVIDKVEAYRVMAVDGSQIYPDRHEGWACGLLRASVIELSYAQHSAFTVHTQQKMIVPSEEKKTVHVDAERQQLELDFLLTTCTNQQPDCVLFDGSLIYWQLEDFSDTVKEEFLGRYLAACYQLYSKKIPYVGFVSLPNSCDLVDYLQHARDELGKTEYSLEGLKDRDIMQVFLPATTFSPIFSLGIEQITLYPESLRPYFLYFNTGREIVRIEIPAWVVHEPAICRHVLSCIVDQCSRGMDYPLALAEAHAAAVLSAADRHVFYQVLQQHALRQGHAVPHMSRKLYSKQKLRS